MKAAVYNRYGPPGVVRIEEIPKPTVSDHEVEVDPGFLDLGATIHGIGVPLEVMLDEFERVLDFAREAAARYVALFERHVWEPIVASGIGEADFEQVAGAIGALRESAIAVVAGGLRQAIDDAAADAVARHAPELTATAVPRAVAPRGGGA